MSKQCPKCGATDTVKASLAHEAGTSDINAVTVGAGLDGGGVGVGAAKSRGTSQSLLAMRVAPPAGKYNSGVLFLVLAGLATYGCISVGLPWWVWLILVLASGGLVSPLFMAEAREHQQKLKEYELKWLCQRCGEISSFGGPKATAPTPALDLHQIQHKLQASISEAQWVCSSCNGPLNYQAEPCPTCALNGKDVGPSTPVIIAIWIGLIVTVGLFAFDLADYFSWRPSQLFHPAVEKPDPATAEMMERAAESLESPSDPPPAPSKAKRSSEEAVVHATANKLMENPNESLALMINMSGQLCARVRSSWTEGGALMVKCTEYRSGAGKATYRIDTSSGEVERVD